jgi:hypothetical protein
MTGVVDVLVAAGAPRSLEAAAASDVTGWLTEDAPADTRFRRSSGRGHERLAVIDRLVRRACP